MVLSVPISKQLRSSEITLSFIRKRISNMTVRNLEETRSPTSALGKNPLNPLIMLRAQITSPALTKPMSINMTF